MYTTCFYIKKLNVAYLFIIYLFIYVSLHILNKAKLTTYLKLIFWGLLLPH
jgi:hypothetical protein